jgi:hypothetical protein
MEEQKKSKVISMNTPKTQEKKLTYEQLNDACNQLWQQNKQLAMKNRELEQFAMNKRLDYLFQVLEFSKEFSSDFVGTCASEIEDALTITQEEAKKEE